MKNTTILSRKCVKCNRIGDEETITDENGNRYIIVTHGQADYCMSGPIWDLSSQFMNKSITKYKSKSITSVREYETILNEFSQFIQKEIILNPKHKRISAPLVERLYYAQSKGSSHDNSTEDDNKESLYPISNNLSRAEQLRQYRRLFDNISYVVNNLDNYERYSSIAWYGGSRIKPRLVKVLKTLGVWNDAEETKTQEVTKKPNRHAKKRTGV